MSILTKMESLKTKFYKRKASKLKKLRQTRIREEGFAKIKKIETKEKLRIKKAKEAQRKGGLFDPTRVKKNLERNAKFFDKKTNNPFLSKKEKDTRPYWLK